VTPPPPHAPRPPHAPHAPPRLLRWIAAGLATLIVAGLVIAPRVAWPETGNDRTDSRTGASVLPPSAPSDRSTVRIAGDAPWTFDPARQGDVGTAAVLAQLFEGLTAFGPDLSVKPALASSWHLSAEGRSLTFTLREGARYSDGSPVRPTDVVESWLHVLDPATGAPLASLLDDVEGAVEYREGRGPRNAVGIRATDDGVEVRFRRPASYFPAIAASPSLAVVPPSMLGSLAGPRAPGSFTGSGGYVVDGQEAGRLHLTANEHYWAGRPAIESVEILTDLDGRSPVDVFLDGEVDYAPVSLSDAQWMRFDPDLGPQLRRIGSLSVDYYGFDATRAPFDDARVRRAFAQAVDWRRIAELTPGVEVATSLIPAGIRGRGVGDYVPPYDPEGARAELAAAGYPGGRGFPAVRLVTGGSTYDEAIVAELRRELGVEVTRETMPFEDYLDRLDTDPPAFWSVSWIADYPAPEDFLGLLLASGASSNYGGWSSAAFDGELAAAGRSADPTEQARHYDAAQRIVRDEAPVIPVSYGESWSLSRRGLLGAIDPGLGIVRLAGLAWSEDR
jgi:ABC-type transport system substrate-binding protein